MPSSHNNEASSPSASSLFLPLARRPRHDSRSSLSNPLDQDALNEALNSIHSAASQSQVLTVFNEYTDPPPSHPNVEAKGLAEELQGGLSGLYNRIRASVAAPRESEEHRSAGHKPRVHEDWNTHGNKTISGPTSRAQSPSIAESVHPSETRSQASIPSKKLSNPATPDLRSPTSLPQKMTNLLADPTQLELKVHASKNTERDLNTGSKHGHVDPQIPTNPDLIGHDHDLENLSGSQSGSKSPDRSLASPTIPSLSFTGRERPGQGKKHERGFSDQSLLSQSSSRSKAPGLPYVDIQSGIEHVRSTPVSPTSPGSSRRNHIGIDAVASDHIYTDASEAPLHTSSKSLEDPSLQAVRLRTRISSSRLPGFAAFKASSSDSLIPSSAAPPAKSRLRQDLDGTHDNRAASMHATFVIPKLRSKLLSRDFWMRDENARDCFHCGETFSTFRRKHHCRTCGQIFDNRCTMLIDGSHFGVVGSVRVCRPCQAMIAVQDDDSSEYSIEDIVPPEATNPPQSPIVDRQVKSSQLDDDTASTYSQSLEHMTRTPVMAYALRKAVDNKSRSSAVLEFDAPIRPLPRPSSSKSLKAAHSVGHGHKRHHSRHQHIRTFKAYHEDRAPFQRKSNEEVTQDRKQSAFHRDSIIDPDLAQYLSDDASSGDDESLQLDLHSTDVSRAVPDPDKPGTGGLLAAVRKGRSRIGDRNIASLLSLSKEGDIANFVASRGVYNPRAARTRNLSVASSVHQRTTPRTTRENLHVLIPDGPERNRPVSPSLGMPLKRSRMIRSASMRGAGAPAIELNRASLQHVHKLLRQMLTDAEVPHVPSWQNALVPILLRATDDVDPDVQAGDDIDIRNYVKLKKIPGGKPGDTSYVSGLVFTKNVALKSMSRHLTNPKILIITFSLEYARHEQHFMSLDPVIRQEREYLANLVGRIAALEPDILLVEKNVSGLALELLDKASITTAYNVKSSVLEAVSRCTESRIIHSMDKLALQPSQLGTCETFEVKTFAWEGRKKTYIYFSGCSPSLGCTIAIRGANRQILARVKRITDFMIYVVYNLKLETCLMRDEWASIPTVDALEGTKPPSGRFHRLEIQTSTNHSSAPDVPNVDLDQRGSEGKSLESVGAGGQHSGGAAQADTATATRYASRDGPEIPDDVPVPTFYESLVEKHQTKILCASPYVKFMPPYLLMRARELERRVAYLKQLRDQDLSVEQTHGEKAKGQKFTLIQPDMVHDSLSGQSEKVKEIVRAVHESEYDKALHNYETQKKQWEAYLSGNKNLFDPYAHQNIVVLFSLVSTATSVPCSGPDTLAFSFYNEHETEAEFEADCTLGQFIEDLCYRANDLCSSPTCEKKLYEHHRQYVHGEGQINVFVYPREAKLPRLENTILMWSQCRICRAETTVTPMSTSTWKYSFGKYLELSFWSADLHARASVCPHDLHRDHLRFFGYKHFALHFIYDPIDLLDIVVPRMRITWKVENDLKFRNDVYIRVERRLTKFMGSVKYRLKSIKADALLPENVDACRVEIDTLTKKANDDHTQLIKLLQERYTNSKHWETIPFNRAIKATLEKVTEWENIFSEFEQNFLPSEKDIRRLATLQLKKIFLDRDVSVTSLNTTDDGTATPPPEETLDEKSTAAIEGADGIGQHRKSIMLSTEKAQNVLQSVVKEHTSSSQTEDIQSAPSRPGSVEEVALLPSLPKVSRNTQDVQHLDLALPLSSERGYSATVTDKSKEEDSPNVNTTTSADGPEDALPEAIPSRIEPLETIAISPPNLPITSGQQIHRNRSAQTPKLFRTHSQPANSGISSLEKTNLSSSTVTAINETNGFGAHVLTSRPPSPTPLEDSTLQTMDQEFPDRLGVGHLKPSKFVKSRSLIPRAVSHRKESRVSNLAKHFEQLSREFEKERIRERRQRAADHRQSRVYVAPLQPIVEIYKNVDEAVHEEDTSEASFAEDRPERGQPHDEIGTVAAMAETEPIQTNGEAAHGEPIREELVETDNEMHETSRATSDVEEQNEHTEDDLDLEGIRLPDSPEDLLRLSQADLDFKELQKHERTSLMRLLTNFWAERSSSGWAPLDFPIRPAEHVFADCDIIVREDEPSSIIAFALNSEDYKSMLYEIQEHSAEPAEQDSGNIDKTQNAVLHSLLRTTGSHLKYQFQQGQAKMLCKVFFAEQFDAVRRKCGVADRIVESLSRCMKWDSKGGKTKSLFLKTLDDRFVLKSLSPIETQSFLKFAPNYFQIMSEAFFQQLPSVIAKMLGFYQIIIRNSTTGVEYNWFLLVMENLFYDRVPTRIFDLKGSMRNRKIESTGEQNEVLLDENMVEFIYESPLFTRTHSKKLLKSSVHNDTLFLARQNVMDYSLMVAIDETREELVVGIIDCIRTYTWDKKLESWIKDRGFAGGNKNRPTVTSPKEYKKRFREAMGRYVLEAPNCWHQVRPAAEQESRQVVLRTAKDEEQGPEGDRLVAWD